PGTREPAPRGRFEPEARVVLGMADDDDEWAAALAEQVQALPHQFRPDAAPLALGDYGHWRQPHSLDRPALALDRRGREEDMADDRVVLGHQGQRVRAILPQTVDEIRLQRLPERQLVDLPDSGGVVGPLGADGHWVFLSPSRGDGVARRRAVEHPVTF